MRTRPGQWLPPLALLVALVGGWEAYADSGAVDSLILPPPHAVAHSLYTDRVLLAQNFATTATEVAVGIVVSLTLGAVMAVLIHLSCGLRRALYPLLVGSQAVPVLVLAPLLVFWWGFGMLPRLAVIVIVCFFPVVVTTVDALDSVDPDQLKLLRTLDASRWQAFRLAEVPTALPAAISGAKISLAVAVIGAFIAESGVAASSGLGHEIVSDIPGLQTARAYAAVVVLTVFAVSCFYVLALAERRLAPWAHRARADR